MLFTGPSGLMACISSPRVAVWSSISLKISFDCGDEEDDDHDGVSGVLLSHPSGLPYLG